MPTCSCLCYQDSRQAHWHKMGFVDAIVSCEQLLRSCSTWREKQPPSPTCISLLCHLCHHVTCCLFDLHVTSILKHHLVVITARHVASRQRDSTQNLAQILSALATKAKSTTFKMFIVVWCKNTFESFAKTVVLNLRGSSYATMTLSFKTLQSLAFPSRKIRVFYLT